jgi:hypothetical protein
VFGRNWDTEVTFELRASGHKDSTRFIETTQGRLFTALWHGDISVFDSDSNPGMPLQLMQVLTRLEEAVPAAKEMAGKRPTFIMAMDAANRISRMKHLKVSSALRSHFKAERELMTPMDVGLSAWESIAPTIDIAFYVMGQGTNDEIHDVLKNQLYVPSKRSKSDNFSLARHGLLLAD